MPLRLAPVENRVAPCSILFSHERGVNLLGKNGIYEIFQSEYNGAAMFLLLDLSVALDNIDHKNLIGILDSYSEIMWHSILFKSK